METDLEWREKMLRLAEGTGAAPPPHFLTQVFSCRGGLTGYTPATESLRHPLYELEYAERSEAEHGHRQTVELLASGKLRL